MENLDNLSNNQIILAMKEMEQEHEAIKNIMLKKYDEYEAERDKDFKELVAVEKRYAEAGELLKKRLNTNI